MDIREYSEFNSESYLASTAIEKIHDPQFRGLSFMTSATEGAILTLPDGAISRDFDNVPRFRAYAAAHIENWYRYVNGPRGREVKNGEIRLVYGCDKATSWGMAAVANITQNKTHYLNYRSIEDIGPNTAPIPLYKWEYTGLAEARVGPELKEIANLKRNDDSDVAVEGKYWNQSLFIRALNLTVSEEVFAKISREVESALIQESQQYRNMGASGNLNSSTSNPLHTSAQTGQQLGASLETQTESTSESLGSVAQELAVDNTEREQLTMSRSASAPKSHPADVLNALLLQQVPNSRVIITQDNDWCSVVNEDDKIMPSPSEIAERVLAVHHIREEDGVVFLEAKQEHQWTFRQYHTTYKNSVEDHTDLLRHTSSSSRLVGKMSSVPSSRGPELAWYPPSRADSLNNSSALSPSANVPVQRTSDPQSLRPSIILTPHNIREDSVGFLELRETTDSFASVIAEVGAVPSMALRRVSTASNSALMTVDGIQLGGDSIDTIIAVVAEVGQALAYLPYFKPLYGLILQFIKIRNEIKINRNRCQEIIDKVLRKSKIIYERLLEISNFQGKVRDNLQRLESSLLGYQKVLKEVFKALEPNLNRGAAGFFRVISNRGVDELNQCDRLVDSIHNDIMLDLIMEIRIGHAVGVPSLIDDRKSLPSIPTSSDIPVSILPPKPRLMVDRVTALERFVEMLDGNESSRVAILGDEGFGKTTLALYVLHDKRIAESFAARYYLSCESITNAQSLLIGLANILSISPAQSSTKLLASVSRALETRRTVLCLDNFETPWEFPHSRNKVEEALASISTIPHLSLIIAVRGTERPSTVAWSMPLLPPLDKLSQSGAEAIVRDIAGPRAVDQQIRPLLQAVDGIPLVITLISSLLRDSFETSNSLWKRWQYMERRQESVWGEDVKFTQAPKVDAGLAISINSPQMKKYEDATQILSTLSLLPDGCSSAADELEKLFGFLDMDDVHKCLVMLKDLALIRTDESSTPHRIRMLASIGRLCQKFSSSEVEVARQKLTDYYVNVVISTGPPSVDASERTEMVREIRNMHSIFRSRYLAGRLDSETTLQNFIKASYFLTLWSTHLGYVLDDIPQMAIEAASHLPIPRAHCLLAQCGVFRRSERFKEAEQYCRQALSIFQDANDLPGQGDAIAMLSGIFDDKGDPRKGEELSSQTRELAALSRKRKQLDKDEESRKTELAANEGTPNIPQWQTALIHLQLGIPTIYMTSARLKSTIDSLYKALELYEKDRNYMGQATALFHIAFAYLLKNELNYARAIVERSLEICGQVVIQIANHELPSLVGMMFNDLTSESEMQAVFLTLLGHIHIREDRLVEAKAILKKAVKKKAAYSVTPVLRLGWLYLRRNQLDKAEKTFNDLQKRCRMLRFWEEEHDTLAYQGVIHLRRGNLDAAEAALTESRKRGLLLWSEIDVLQVLGDVYIQKDQLQLAEEILTHALRMQNQIDSAFGQGNVLRSLGDLHGRRGKFAEALAAYEGARTFHHAAHWISEEMEDVERIAFLHRRHGNTRVAEETIAEVRRLKALMS